LSPGDRIPEPALARELGVSRSPIREALGQLVREGLAQFVPYRGAIVTPVDPARFREIVDFRVALEEFAVRRIAEIAKPADLERIAGAIASLRALARRRDFEGAVAADLALHEILIALARNRPLERTYTALLNEFRLYIRLTARTYTSIAELADEHDVLLSALRDRRTDAAVESIRGHIVRGLDSVLQGKSP
jgi:DNA-binding GntR family transcriptional regulator